MWEAVLLIGIIVIGLGILRRTTSWGKGVALAGATGIVVALVVAGPEMMNAAQQAYQEGRAAGQGWPEQ
ncbi:hypothetical protein [Salinibacter altiplanensis]|uniref:hypothetical protein n=1 Tax=Salinibacter altiplanensis TaxID=1803181 RepID=UPI000C9F9F6F|nr:hypothetical protein [Salinibacter altiplanensis]